MEVVMPSITVKNIPTEIYARLKQAAKANRRSINSEVIACIERAVGSQTFNPDMLLAKARMLREKTAAYQINDEELTQAKNSGRP
jgi:plasmid stability protein